MLIPVVMAGGSGSRLWPLSRTKYPKQFLTIAGEHSMLQQTLMRLKGLPHDEPLLICNEEHRFLLAEQLRSSQLEHGGIILEPVGRNTAPAIAISALEAVQKDPDAVLLILAADHIIKDTNAFHDSIRASIPYALRGDMVTFGIKVTSPETGYGYIKAGVVTGNEKTAYKVASFVEKPNLQKAKEYCEDSRYLWNSGMFMFKASVYLDELRKYRPDIYDGCKLAHESSYKDLDFTRMSTDLFANVPDESVDFAVMENTDKAVVMPLNAEWSDVGSWAALWEVNDKDDMGNSTRGDVLVQDTQNSYVYSQSKLVATVGVDNLVVVETKDAVLIANKDKVQDVKSIVNHLSNENRTEHLEHREIYRPWGAHDTISQGERFHVKKVIVKPKQKTALQMHYHRTEHWIIVSGTAKVTKGDEVLLLGENESIYIPMGVVHAIENPGVVPLELIEVRSGTYLLEDDVVRLEDAINKPSGDY